MGAGHFGVTETWQSRQDRGQNAELRVQSSGWVAIASMGCAEMIPDHLVFARGSHSLIKWVLPGLASALIRRQVR